jgi:hypothetical protein
MFSCCLVKSNVHWLQVVHIPSIKRLHMLVKCGAIHILDEVFARRRVLNAYNYRWPFEHFFSCLLCSLLYKLLIRLNLILYLVFHFFSFEH